MKSLRLWIVKRWSDCIQVPVHVCALMNNTDNLDASRHKFIEHDMSALGEAPVARFHFISLPTEQRVGCQVIETSKQDIKVAFRLIDAPLFNCVIPNRLEVVPGEGAQAVSCHYFDVFLRISARNCCGEKSSTSGLSSLA